VNTSVPAVRVQRLTKEFPLFPSPRHRLFSALGLGNANAFPAFRALDAVSLEIAKGTTVGIIGRNGSGKSTLLQILCGILQPTGGSVETSGRVSGILDLGGGFNPELTGRENVALRSALLADDHDRPTTLDDIERFADIGGFFDRPLKTYSSGMFVRLAFAAAIHTDPDILVIDEALAVGDARFQHRCFHKIAELRARGKTIVLVTHSTDAVVRHCDEAYLLEAGSLVCQGQPRNIVHAYLELLFTGRLSPSTAPAGGATSTAAAQAVALFTSGRAPAAEPWDRGPLGAVDRFLSEPTCEDRCPAHASYNRYERRIGDRRGTIVDYLLETAGSEAADLVTLAAGGTLAIYIKARFTERVDNPMFGMSLKTPDGVVVHASNSRYRRLLLDAVNAEETIVFRFVLSCPLHPGDYFLDLGIAELELEIDRPIDVRYGLVHFAVQSESRFDGLVDLTADAGEVCRTIGPAKRVEVAR
jgi:lipopolysaccharide transport system ATP-binding protein